MNTAPQLPAGTRILVVDDTQDIRFVLAYYLNQKGAEVLTAETASEGIETALREKPNLILMDMQLPDMDGYIATRRLKQSGFAAPIIAMTGNTIVGMRERCIRAGCSDYLSKPVPLGHLMRTIIQYLAVPSTNASANGSGTGGGLSLKNSARN